VGQQGDSIKLLEERTKTYARRKVVFGGTPSIKGISAIEAAYQTGDQRQFFVPCPDCGESHVLDWANVSWQEDPARHHPVYGHAAPESAVYGCPHCGSAWTDDVKNRAVRNLYPVAARPHAGIVSFSINELYSPWRRWSDVVKDFLSAKQSPETLKTWINTSLGETWEEQAEKSDPATLLTRRENYTSARLPSGILYLTAGADVQDDRLENPNRRASRIHASNHRLDQIVARAGGLIAYCQRLRDEVAELRSTYDEALTEIGRLGRDADLSYPRQAVRP
jgi:phage terminase large subunit GpA-like protein